MRKKIRTQLSGDLGRSNDINNKLTYTDQEYDIPLSSKALFWPVQHPVTSPLLSRLPFLFWLMETSRPQKILQIGLGDGLVYMAMCQAAERLGGRTLCVGIDPGDSPLPIAMRVHHDAQYSDISTLLPTGVLHEGRGLVKDVDILVLNTRLNEEQSEIILKSWLPQLSERAIVLTYDSIRVLGSTDLRRELLDETKYSIIGGPMSPGGDLLNVTLYGVDQPERLRRLSGSNNTSAVQLAAQQVFSRLGQGIVDAWEVATHKSNSANSAKQNNDLREHTERFEQTLADTRKQTNMLRLKAIAERTGTKARANSELQTSGVWLKEKSALAARVTELEESLDASQRESRSEIDGLRKQNLALKAQHAMRIEDIAVLMQHTKAKLDGIQKNYNIELDILRLENIKIKLKTEEMRSHMLSLETRHTTQVDSLSKKIIAISNKHVEEKSAAENKHDELIKLIYSSTSWRMTRPLRSLKLTLRRYFSNKK
jgi:hypothetical protein